MKSIIVILVVAMIAGVSVKVFASLADAAGYTKPYISADQDGRVILGHRIGPDGNLVLVYKN